VNSAADGLASLLAAVAVCAGLTALSAACGEHEPKPLSWQHDLAWEEATGESASMPADDTGRGRAALDSLELRTDVDSEAGWSTPDHYDAPRSISWTELLVTGPCER